MSRDTREYRGGLTTRRRRRYCRSHDRLPFNCCCCGCSYYPHNSAEPVDNDLCCIRFSLCGERGDYLHKSVVVNHFQLVFNSNCQRYVRPSFVVVVQQSWPFSCPFNLLVRRTASADIDPARRSIDLEIKFLRHNDDDALPSFWSLRITLMECIYSWAKWPLNYLQSKTMI